MCLELILDQTLTQLFVFLEYQLAFQNLLH